MANAPILSERSLKYPVRTNDALATKIMTNLKANLNANLFASISADVGTQYLFTPSMKTNVVL